MRAAVCTAAFRLPRGTDSAEGLARRQLAIRPARLARMDCLCALALSAADGALAAAGFTAASLARVAPDRFGLVIGTRYGCHATNEDYYRGFLEAGPRGASPRLFTYTLPSSPVGELGIHFGARGVAETVTSGRHAGLEAIARASDACSAGRADLVVAVVVEVGGGVLVGAQGGGAVALCFEAEEAARAAGRKGIAKVVGSSVGFHSGEPDRALAAARGRLTVAGGAARDLAILDEPGALAAAEAVVMWIADGVEPGEAVAVTADEAGGAAGVWLGR